MRQTNVLAGLMLVTGMMLAGAGSLAAQDWRDAYGGRPDIRDDYRDMAHDYAHVDEMRADIASDRARLDEDIRCGRQDEAARDAADLARDQRRLRAQYRDIHHDRWESYGDRYRDRDRREMYRDRVYFRGDWR